MKSRKDRGRGHYSIFVGFLFSIGVCVHPCFSFTNSQDFYPEPNPPFVDLPDRKDPPQRSIQQDSSANVEWLFHKTADNLHPDGNEQQLLWLMNRARSNPAKEGDWLLNTGHPAVESAIRYYNVDKSVLRREFNGIAATPPVAFDVRLYTAAKNHSDDLIRRNSQDHDRQFLRVRNAGFLYKNARGNVYSYGKDAVHAHAGFNIDWGPGTDDGMQAERGHRKAIMSTEKIYTNVGLAVVSETNPTTQVGPFVITGNYCSTYEDPATNHYNRFMVGTVWNDRNNNDQYDPGEGIAGVKVTPETGPYYAVTSNSGGYAIPMMTPGSYEVTFSGEKLSIPLQRFITLSSQSVPLDVVHDNALVITPPQIRAAYVSGLRGYSATLRANVKTNNDLTYYYFEYGKGGRFDIASPTKSLTTDGEVRLELNNLQLDTVYSYRLVAHNSAGVTVDSNKSFKTPRTPVNSSFWNLFLPVFMVE